MTLNIIVAKTIPTVVKNLYLLYTYFTECYVAVMAVDRPRQLASGRSPTRGEYVLRREVFGYKNKSII